MSAVRMRSAGYACAAALGGAVAGGVMALGFAAPADAAIRCEGAFQHSGGSLISTPYCEDQNLARVAQSYGMRVSGAQVRGNPNSKRRVCEFIGHDPRVASACSGYRNDGDRQRWNR